MVDGLQLLDEHRLGILDVAERDGALAEIALSHLCVDDTFHKVADRLFGIVLQRARGSLHSVGHHQTGVFTCERIGSRIGEQQVVDGILGMLVLIVDIEVFGLAQSVVGGDEVANDLGQVVLVCHLHTFCHVTDDQLGTLNVRQHLVGIDTRLVFSEIDGV